MMILKHYAWLFVASVFAIWSSTQIQFWPKSIQDMVVFLPYIAVALGLFIALWLNRIQPALVLLSLGCFNAVLLYFSLSTSGLELTVNTLFPALIILLPLNILLWMLLPEKGVFNKRLNMLIIVIFAIQAGVLYWLMLNSSLDSTKEWMNVLTIPIIQNSNFVLLSFSVGLMFLLTIFFVASKMNQSGFKTLYHAVFVVLILMLYGINQGFDPSLLAWFSVFSAMILTLSMIFEAHHIAYTDELTGISGRRALMEYFLGLGKKYVVAMVDIDHFKKFNDTYGHDAGDDVLRRVALVLEGVKAGRAFRYGGEEFTLVFVNKTIAEVMPELEYIRRKIESSIIEFRAGERTIKTHITVSIGVAQANQDFKVVKEVLKLADLGLYEAKQAGRNTIVIREHSPSQVKANYYKGSKSDNKPSNFGG